MSRLIGRWLLLCLLAGAVTACQASALRYCDQPATLSAAQKDRLLRFGAILKTALDDSAQDLALIARSGLDLSRFGLRYSHAGISLRSGLDTPWSVRQLYYACDERKPRVFDQGMTGFLLGLDDPAIGYVSIVLLPSAEADRLTRAVLDKRQALQLLGARYSANAYAFGLAYQNCNQWVAEMLATAWSGSSPPSDQDRSDANEALSPGAMLSARARAQDWLRGQGYEPSVFDIGWPLMWAGAFVPWLHSDDHPREDLSRHLYRVSMPTSIEGIVRSRVPAARRLEFCHTDTRVVMHEGWDAIAEGCVAGVADKVFALD